jgi:hypothetical protein
MGKQLKCAYYHILRLFMCSFLLMLTFSKNFDIFGNSFVAVVFAESYTRIVKCQIVSQRSKLQTKIDSLG